VHDYLFPSEVVRFAFVFGICVAMMLYERRHLTTGSIVVPGYIAIFIPAPMVLVVTFLNALITYWLMNGFIRKRFLLYGRTKFTVMALISIALQSGLLKVSPSGPWLWESNFPLFVGAGYVVPALIAHDMGRQGVRRTTRAVLAAGAIVSVPILIAIAVGLPGITDLAPLTGYGEMSIVGRWVPLAVLLSAAAAWGVFTNWGLKSGGFVGAAYIGMFMGDPYQVAVMFAVAVVSFAFVRYVLMRWLILFGRRKFSAMLLTSSMISWTLLWSGQWIFSARVSSHLDMASLALIPLFVPGLLANDMDRTSPVRVVGGVTLAAGVVVPVTWWVQSIVEGTTLDPAWKLVAVAATIATFGPQMQMLIVATARVLGSVGARRRQRMREPLVTHPQQIAVGELVEAQDHLDELADVLWSAEELARWRAEHTEASLDADAWLAAQLGEVGRTLDVDLELDRELDRRLAADLQLADTLRAAWASLDAERDARRP
jgi:poly-gamma-glutamate biosynthesis protein PgsC/CapC